MSKVSSPPIAIWQCLGYDCCILPANQQPLAYMVYCAKVLRGIIPSSRIHDKNILTLSWPIIKPSLPEDLFRISSPLNWVWQTTSKICQACCPNYNYQPCRCKQCHLSKLGECQLLSNWLTHHPIRLSIIDLGLTGVHISHFPTCGCNSSSRDLQQHNSRTKIFFWVPISDKCHVPGLGNY